MISDATLKVLPSTFNVHHFGNYTLGESAGDKAAIKSPLYIVALSLLCDAYYINNNRPEMAVNPSTRLRVKILPHDKRYSDFQNATSEVFPFNLRGYLEIVLNRLL